MDYSHLFKFPKYVLTLAYCYLWVAILLLFQLSYCMGCFTKASNNSYLTSLKNKSVNLVKPK